MPYNTRRKSLSLSSLGIHVPSSHPRSKASAAAAANTNRMPSPRSASESSSAEHPNKKVKRSHTPATKFERTPPPSPGVKTSIETDEHAESDKPKTIYFEGINDEIVQAVIVRLQETGYLKRTGWSAAAPCPLAKELETIHPRRTYFYLTTCPHQPLPDPSAVAPSSNLRDELVTPSLSSSGSTTEDAEGDRRRELSLSPEIDLSSPEFEDAEEDIPMPGTPMGSASGRRHPSLSSMSQRGGGEPPLEKDEKEFTQTADGLQKRKMSGGLLAAAPVDQVLLDDGLQNELLFGEHNRNLAPTFFPYMTFMTSPAMRPSIMPPPPKRDVEAESWTKLDAMLEWDRSPETVELDELDGLLNGF